MSLFSTSKYSQQEHALSKKEIKGLVSRLKISTLSSKEEKMIEEMLLKRRGADGKISLRQIEDVLKKLKNQGKISLYDRKGVLKVFDSYFDKKD